MDYCLFWTREAFGRVDFSAATKTRQISLAGAILRGILQAGLRGLTGKQVRVGLVLAALTARVQYNCWFLLTFRIIAGIYVSVVRDQSKVSHHLWLQRCHEASQGRWSGVMQIFAMQRRYVLQKEKNCKKIIKAVERKLPGLGHFFEMQPTPKSIHCERRRHLLVL